jgi:hypothetical protein
MSRSDQFKHKTWRDSPLTAFLNKRNNTRATDFASSRNLEIGDSTLASQNTTTQPQGRRNNQGGNKNIVTNKKSQQPNRSNAPNGSDFNSLQQSMNQMNGTLTGLSSLMTQFVSSHKELNTRVEITEDAMASVSSKLNYHDQKEHNAKMRISGMQITNPENPLDDVKNLFTEYGIKFENVEILKAYTKEENHGEERRVAVIVIFLHELIKDRIMMEKINKDKGKAVTVYFNHFFTRANGAMHAEARKLVKEKKIFKSGFRNGKVYVIPRENAPKIWISNFSDLNTVTERNQSNDDNLIEFNSDIGNGPALNDTEA